MKKIHLTNVLLAIIAFCLVFNLLVNGNLISKANAQTTSRQEKPLEVKIVDVNGSIPVLLENIGDGVYRDKPIPVTIIKEEE